MTTRFVAGSITLFLAMFASLAQAQDSIDVKIDNNAALIDGGEAVEVGLKIACPEGYDVLEAFLYVVQGDNSSHFGFFPVVCDGRKHKVTGLAHAMADSPLFRRGNANVSMYILLVHQETGETLFASPGGRIKIR